MKKVLLGGAVAVLSIGTALAADLPAQAPVYKAPPVFSWSGFYGGIHGGYGFGSNDLYDQYIGSFETRYKPSGGFGGVQIGYNSQFAPHWLIGGEIDASFGSLSDTAAPSNGVNPVPSKDKIDAFGTARTRFGYVQDRSLIYGTFGAIWLHEKYTGTLVGIPVADQSQYLVGYVFGGGYEYAIDPRWSFRLEYLYAPLEKTSDTYQFNRKSDLGLNIVRVGVNYRFGDESVSAPAFPVKAAPLRSHWSGSYIGVHGGYALASLDQTFGLGASDPYRGDIDPDGFFGGLQSGYNWLYAPQSLFGVEVDSSWGALDDTGSLLRLNAGTSTPASAKIKTFGTARLRLGYLAAPDTLLYATGGAAYAREESSDPQIFSSTKAYHVGWTAGAGVEWMFAPEWSVKAEYLYADFGTIRNDNPGLLLPKSSDLTMNSVRVGINYYGPIIERFFGSR